MSREITYESYLNLDRILNAQLPPGPDGEPRALAHHDELLFVIVHQVYELWFTQVLHELDRTRDLLVRDPVPEADIQKICEALHRVHEIQKLMLAQIGVIETMSPVDFLAFRDSLGSASGFQSAQFRELEILAGLQDDQRYAYQGDSFQRRFPPETIARFDERRSQPSLREALERWLERTPLEEGFQAAYLEAFDRYVETQRALHESNSQLSEEEREAALARLDDYRGTPAPHS
jgi:tryptophan 2,3-dioxygenase